MKGFVGVILDSSVVFAFSFHLFQTLDSPIIKTFLQSMVSLHRASDSNSDASGGLNEVTVSYNTTNFLANIQSF